MTRAALAVALALCLCLLTGATGRYGLNGRNVSVSQTDYGPVECGDLADPGYTPVNITSATDLHAAVTANCATGCEIVLAPGTYTDTSVTIGDSGVDSAIKVGSLTNATGVVWIHGSDPDNPPVLVNEAGILSAVVHARNMTGLLRVEDVIIDGNKANQTNGAITTVCTDSAPADGTCDTGSQTSSRSHGIYMHSTVGSGKTTMCVRRVEVRNTVATGIQISNGYFSTVSDSWVHDIGCTPASCPGLSIPLTNENSAITYLAQGIQIGDAIGSSALRNTVERVTKIGIECFVGTVGSRGCNASNNRVDYANSAGIGFVGGVGVAIRNTITNTGKYIGFDTTTTKNGHGMTIRPSLANSLLTRVRVEGNSVSDSWGGGILVHANSPSEVPAGYRVEVIGNTVTNACDGTTRTTAASFEMGDETDQLHRIDSRSNIVNGTLCGRGFSVSNLDKYVESGNRVVGSTGGYAVEYDSVTIIDSKGIDVSDDIYIDAASDGAMRNCTFRSGSVIAGETGNVAFSDCESASVGSSLWDTMQWDSDVWG